MGKSGAIVVISVLPPYFKVRMRTSLHILLHIPYLLRLVDISAFHSRVNSGNEKTRSLTRKAFCFSLSMLYSSSSFLQPWTNLRWNGKSTSRKKKREKKKKRGKRIMNTSTISPLLPLLPRVHFLFAASKKEERRRWFDLFALLWWWTVPFSFHTKNFAGKFSHLNFFLSSSFPFALGAMLQVG